jgi:hypothetical protein
VHFADAEHFEALLGRLELASALEG